MIVGRLQARCVFSSHDLWKKLIQFRDSSEQSQSRIKMRAESKNVVVLVRNLRPRNRREHWHLASSRDIQQMERASDTLVGDLTFAHVIQFEAAKIHARTAHPVVPPEGNALALDKLQKAVNYSFF